MALPLSVLDDFARNGMFPVGQAPAGGEESVVVSLPPSLWAMYERNWDGSQRLSAAAKAWYAENEPVLARLRRPASFPVKVHIVCEVWVDVRRDTDNLIKPIRDGLVKAKVIPDDKVGYVRGGSDDYRPSADGVGVRVWLEPVDPAEPKPKRRRKK